MKGCSVRRAFAKCTKIDVYVLVRALSVGICKRMKRRRRALTKDKNSIDDTLLLKCTTYPCKALSSVGFIATHQADGHKALVGRREEETRCVSALQKISTNATNYGATRLHHDDAPT